MRQFTLRAPSGEALVQTIVPANAPEAQRARWRRTVNSLVFAVLGVTVLLVAASCVLYRDATRGSTFRAMLTPIIIGLILAGRVQRRSRPDTAARQPDASRTPKGNSRTKKYRPCGV